jgi:hypothetical protein
MSQISKKVNIAEKKADFVYKMITRQINKPKSPTINSKSSTINSKSPTINSKSPTINSKSPTIKKKDIKIILADLPDDLKLEITKHLKSLFKYKLRDWVKNWINEQSNKQSIAFEFDNLSSNSNAMDFLTLPNNIEKINYYYLSENTNIDAIPLIAKKIEEEKLLSKTEYKKLKYGINWNSLSGNPIAVKLLEHYENDIVWSAFCGNPNPEALRLIKKELERDIASDNIDWGVLSANPIVIQLFEEYPHYKKYIDYSGLSANPTDEAFELLKERLKKHPGDIDLDMLSSNTNPKAIELLKNKIKRHRDEIDWVKLAGNTAPEAIKILKDNLKKLNLDTSDYEITSALSSNPSDKAFELLEANNRLIDWTSLSYNTNLKAIELLKNNQSNIYWPAFSTNPAIFILQ